MGIIAMSMPDGKAVWFEMAIRQHNNIIELETQAIELARSVEGSRKRKERIELQVTSDVALTMDDKGKPAYSNETIRKSEVASRLGDHLDYQSCCEQIQDWELQQKYAQINLSASHRLFLLAEKGLGTCRD